MNRFIIIILAFVLFAACSYEPILLNKGVNFRIDKIETNGDKEINKLIQNNLNNQSKGDNKYNLFLNTSKKKVIISSDAKGDPKIFKLIISTDYIIEKNNNIIVEDNIIEENTYNNISDKFELLKNEENILKTTAQKITDEITIAVISSII